MQTRISKIARLPHPIREQLNHRLQNGEMGRTLVKWLNEQPETKTVMTDLFDGHAITHQNLSDWRRTGYQDWLMHQQRIEWFRQLGEHETEINQHDQSTDTFEAMSNYFIFELGQAITSLREIKNSHERLNRLETLTREFSRLQNAFNWSRRVGLEFAKFNPPETTDPSEVSDHSPLEIETHDVSGERARPGRGETRPRVSPLRLATSQDLNLVDPPEQEKPETCQPAPRTPEPTDERASVLDCGSPLPLSGVNSTTPTLANSQPPKEIQPIPAPAPTTPPLLNSQPPLPPRPSKPHISPVPIRGRRFVCVEG